MTGMPVPVTVDRVFHALGDATRRTLLERLSHGPTSVSALAEPLAISLAAVVQHLQILEDSGMVETRKIGRVRTCQLKADGLNVATQWLSERRQVWERRFDRLGDILDEPPPHPPTERTTDP